MNFDRQVAVVGGGVTGLSTCYSLEKLGFRDVVLFESSNRLGGKLCSELHEEFLVELGPDAIFTRSPEILTFIEEIGLSDQVIEPAAKGFSIWLEGGLREIPPGVSRVGNLDPAAMAQFKFLSELGKTEALNERNITPNLASDESVGSFFRRRFGTEYAIKIAEPLFAGTHGGNALELSMEALYPAFRSQERKHGSLQAAHDSGESSGGAKFISFRKGTQALGDRITEQLNHTVKRFERVTEIEVAPHKVSLNRQDFRAVVVALPAYLTANLLSAALPEAAQLLSEITAASSDIVTLGYDYSSAQLGLVGTGFLVPEIADLAVRGATWSSQKWSGRSTGDRALLRVFFQSEALGDDALLEKAQKALVDLAGIYEKPVFKRVTRWNQGLPQYRLGHSELVTGIEKKLRTAGPLFVAGQSFRGVGIPDCVKQGRVAAEAVAAAF